MAERFYTNCPLQPGSVVLQGAEAHHLTAVSRHRPGSEVCLFNGDGHEYPARIVSVARKSVVLEITDAVNANRELPFPLEIAAPIPKGERARFLVEKLTELGVTNFVPLLTERSVIDARDAKIEKIKRYVVEASKQCGRNVLMTVAESTKWEDYCRSDKGGKTEFLAHPVKDAGQISACSLNVLQENSIGVAGVVGPEGGFTENEIVLAEQEQWRMINLGPRILRIETAAIVLASYLTQSRNDA